MIAALFLGVLSLLLAPPPGAGPPAAAAAGIAGRLVAEQGTVSLRRSTSSRPWSVSVGAELRLGDTIDVPRDGSALIQCPDHVTLWKPPAELKSGVFQGCPRLPQATPRGLSHKGLRVRDPAVGQEPSVLTPSNTMLLDHSPWIRWRPAAGATRYKVSVFDSRRPLRPIWGPALVSETEIRYGGDPHLDPSTEYFVRVEAEPESPAAPLLLAQGLPFILCTDVERARVQEDLAALTKADLEPLSRDLALAAYLRGRGYRADALAVLEKDREKTKSPAVHLQLAAILEEIGAIASADEVYRHVLELARRQHDRDSEAEASLALAWTTPDLRERSEVARRGGRILREVGDTVRAAKLEELASSRP
jgi:hypothetical protein